MQHTFVDRLAPYVPTDRLHAMAARQELPAIQRGAVLFADISGFTPLTEQLVREHGPRLGGEELTRHLNRVYGGLLDEIERHHGSAIGFSGDAVTCWFTDDDGTRATGCALELQQVMARLRASATVPIALKVAVAAGTARRLVVGDPALHVVDVLCGSLLDRVARGEALARRGDVIVAAEVAAAGGTAMAVSVAGEGFLRVAGYDTPPRLGRWPPVDATMLDEHQLRPWLLPAVHARLRSGQGDYLAELRVAVALFVRFDGLDFERDDAVGAKLDRYVRWVQSVVDRRDGALIQLTTGDKGSYLYCTFGAPVAHEHSIDRAIDAALVLRAPPAELGFITRTHVGVSRGQMRTGAYGSEQRRTYGVLGDETNVAARLMTRAAPGQVLVTEPVVRGAGSDFRFESLGTAALKGKQAGVAVFELAGRATERAQRRSRTREPIIGRAAEREVLHAAIAALGSGEPGRTIILEGEPGIGKSRLVGDLLDRARLQQPRIECLVTSGSAIESAVPYFPWRRVFARAFGLAEPLDAAAVAARLPADLSAFAPLLDAVLPITLPDTPVTAVLAGHARAARSRRFFLRVFDHLVRDTPVVLVVEDAHFLDSSSWTLLELIRLHVDRIVIVLAMRPLAVEPEPLVKLRSLPTTHAAVLGPLTPVDAVALVAQRLAITEVPLAVAALVTQVAEGNPFFAEQLGYTLRESGMIRIVDGACELIAAIDELPFPDTIEGVVTSRIDRLSPSEQLTLKVASVAGRAFIAAPVQEAFPVAAEREHVPGLLVELARLGLTTRDETAPDPRFSFRHAITHDVTYNLMLFEQRRELHARMASWYERTHPDDAATYAIVAHHRLRAIDGAGDPDPEAVKLALDALIKAGQRALEGGATPEAINHLGTARSLLGHVPPSRDRDVIELDLCTWLGVAFAVVRGPEHEDVKRELARARELCQEIEDTPRVFETLFNTWHANIAGSDRDGALAFSAQLLELTRDEANPHLRMLALHARGATLVSIGEHRAALALMEQTLALADAATATSPLSLARNPILMTHCYSAWASLFVGDCDRAVEHIDQALAIAARTSHPLNRAQALGFAALVHRYRRDIAATEANATAAAALIAEHEFPYWRAVISGVRGWLAIERGDVAAGVAELEELARRDREAHAFPLAWIVVRGDLIDGLLRLGRLDDAAAVIAEAQEFAPGRLLGFGLPAIHRLEGELWRQRGDLPRARTCIEQAIAIASAHGARLVELRARIALARLDPETLPALATLTRSFAEGMSHPDLVEARELCRGGFGHLTVACNLAGVWEYVLGRMASELPAGLGYHCVAHTRDDVVPAALRLAELHGLPDADTALLVTGALFHDLGFVECRAGHEAVSARIAREVLPRFGFTALEIDAVAGIILATRLPQSPRSVLEELMADADLDVLGRRDFFAKNDALHREWAAFGDTVARGRWYAEQLAFLRDHRYFTEAARTLRDAGKRANVAELERRLRSTQ